MSIKTCPHCNGYYERMIGGKCPHCDTELGKRIKKKRVCPACGYEFQNARIKDGRRHCLNCGVELYYPQGKLQGETLLLADRDAVQEMLGLLEDKISINDGTKFSFSRPEKTGQLFHGYQLIEEANKFTKKQKRKMPGYKLAILAVEEGLANGLGQARTLVPFRGRSGQLFSLAYAKEMTRQSTVNAGGEAVDFTAFSKGA